MKLNKELSSKVLLGIGSVLLLIWFLGAFFYKSQILKTVYEIPGAENTIAIVSFLGFPIFFFGLITWLFETKDYLNNPAVSKPNHKRNVLYLIIAIPAILFALFITIVIILIGSNWK